MHVAIISEWLVMDETQLVHGLQQAVQALNEFQNDVVLDFSSVRRVDTAALQEMEILAGVSDAHSVRIGLRGVNVDIYKVLKLVKLASRFSFLT